MKYYLHKVIAKKINNRFKITDYLIEEFNNFGRAYQSYLNISNEDKDILIEGKLTTSKDKIDVKVWKPPFSRKRYIKFNVKKNKFKYKCIREHSYDDIETGLTFHDMYLLLETNYKKACDEFLKYVDSLRDVHNHYFVEFVRSEVVSL